MVAPTGGEIAADPERAIGLLAEACRAMVEQDGAQAVILGGAGLAGLAERVQERVSLPVLCSVQAGFAAVVAAARNPMLKPLAGDLSLPRPVDTAGLSIKLRRLLQGLKLYVSSAPLPAIGHIPESGPGW